MIYNFFIWGTGKVAKKFIIDNYNGFFRFNTIISFIDNSPEMQTKKIFNIPIISPSYIKKYTYDYILVASSFDKDITYQIEKKLNIGKEKILHMYNIHNFMHDYWESNYNLSKKRILCIGDVNRYKLIKDIYINRFNIIKCIDICNLELINNYNYDYILFNDLMMISTLDNSKGRIFLENYIINILHKKFNIEINKILCESVFKCYRDIDIKIRGGGES